MVASSVRRINPLDEVMGEPRSPLAFTRSGRPVWPIFGAEPDDDDDDDDSDDEDDDDDDDDDKARKAKSKKKTGDDDEDDPVAEAEARAEKYRKRMRAADRARAAAERERDALKAGKEGDNDQSAVVAEKEKENEALSEANRQLTLQNSFLLNNKFTWHDPEDVMALALNDDDLEVDEDGVHGMEAVLKKIAKRKPWLVKVDKEPADDDGDEDDDEDDTEDDKPPARKSGSANSGRRKAKQVDRQKMLSTYPALNRR